MKSRIYSQMEFVKSKAPYYNETELEIILVLKGILTVHKMERTFALKEGEFTLINRHVVHYLDSENGAYILKVNVPLKQFTHIFKYIEYMEFLNNNEIKDVDRPLKNHLNAIVIDSLIKLYELQFSDGAEVEVEFEENQLMDILLLNYQLITHIKEVEEYPTTELMERYYQVVEYIMKNIHTKIMTEDIVNLVYMNPTYFSQFMKRIGGVGFKEFVYYRKLIMICKYLLNPTYTMNETALMVGISDMKSFYSNFKKAFGISPSKWRNRLSSLEDDYHIIRDVKVYNDFVEAFHIHRHRENTITNVIRQIRNEKELSDVYIEVHPYKNMGDVYDPDYQVFKHLGALERKKSELGAAIVFHFPMRFLLMESQQKILMVSLKESLLMFGAAMMRKDRVVLHATNRKELIEAQKIEKQLLKKVGYVTVMVEYQPI